MSQEQTALVGEDISVTVNVIDNTGSHVAATINTTTTRIEGFPATAPTVTTVNTGIYRIVFSGVSPAPAEGDRLIVKVNGDIAGTAWTEYGIPVKILANDVSTFDQAVDAVITDAASRTASQANVSGLSTFDPATDTVLNVTNVAVTASNTDMRGTDGVVVPTSDITAIKTKTDQLTFSVANQVDANSLTGGTSPADIWSYATRTITSGGITASEVSDAVWDVALSSYNSAGTTGKAIRQIKEGVISQDGAVDDVSATTTTFISNLTSVVDGYYHDKVLVFVSGLLSGQARHIETYTGSTKSITVSQGFTSAPSNGDEFLILATHEHSLIEIADSTWDEQRAGHTAVGSFGYYLDARVSSSGAGASAADIWGALLTDYATAGTFGARFQEGRRYSNTTAQIIYINQSDAYDDTANNAISWEVSKDYSGADSLTITIEHRVTGATILSHAVTYIDATTLKLFLSTADTAFSTLTTEADFGVHPYRITADFAGEKQSVVRGAATIRSS